MNRRRESDFRQVFEATASCHLDAAADEKRHRIVETVHKSWFPRRYALLHRTGHATARPLCRPPACRQASLPARLPSSLTQCPFTPPGQLSKITLVYYTACTCPAPPRPAPPVPPLAIHAARRCSAATCSIIDSQRQRLQGECRHERERWHASQCACQQTQCRQRPSPPV